MQPFRTVAEDILFRQWTEGQRLSPPPFNCALELPLLTCLLTYVTFVSIIPVAPPLESHSARYVQLPRDNSGHWRGKRPAVTFTVRKNPRKSVNEDFH